MALHHNVDFTNTNLQEMSVKFLKKNTISSMKPFLRINHPFINVS